MNSRSKLSFTGLFMIIILLIIAMNCPVAFAADCEDEILVVGNALTSSAVRGITEIDEDQLVWVIVKVDERSLVDANQTGIQWRDFLASEQGRLFRFELEKSQDDILCKIRESGLDYRLGYSYYTLFNGFSLKIRYGDLGAIRNIKGVSDTVLSDWYAAPTAEQSIMHARYFAESVRKYTGKGMSVAVLDTGVNYEHTAFAKAPEYVAYTESQILDLIDELGLRGSYVSPKIPYAFDYADGDSDVYPDNQHGTHVSGISVGSDDVICGAAPDAQLIAMKVFANGTGNAYQTDIVKAVEDAVLLGVDAINLSLGSNAGFTVERDSSAQFIDAVYNMAGRSGVFVCCSAGNGYSSAFGIEGGGAFPQNPDYGILASPSTYTGSFSVASIDTYEIFSLEARGEKFTYTETVNEDRVKNMLMDVFLKECGYGDYDYVTVGGYGEEGDYEGLDVKGKVTLVKRGEISFEEKARIASENGAVFCLVWNNENTGINPMVTNITIPVVIIDKYIGEYLAGADGGVLSFSESNRTIGMSDFSSWGTTADLDLKPDLTAPGGGIYSAYGDSYTSMSGTSMASPYVAGAAVSAKQYVREVFGYGLTPKEEQGLVYSLLMSTADIVYDAYGNPYPVRKQGAGLINPEAAYSTKVMLAVRGSERAKIRLGDDKDRVGAYNIAFDAVNFSDEDVEYTVDVLTLYERIRFDNILSGYAGTLSPEIRVICNNDITDGVVRIGANSVASIIISVVLSEESKLFLNENYVNGAFIEGFARLSADGEPALSIPYLTFYGDFAAIPAFDSDVYDDEKCQVYETRLLGLLGNTNVVQMGRYCYELPEGYEMPEDDPDKIALSYFNGAVNTFYQIQAGLLKNISRLEYTVTDKYTGEAVWSGETYNVKKSYFSVEQNALYVAPVNADLKVSKMNLSNNQELLLTLRAYSCYDESVYDQVEYPITVDFEYPRLMGHSFRQEDGRIILDLQVFDNQYLQDIQIYTYNSNKQYEIIDSYAIPVYGFRKGHTNSFSLDVTRYMELVQNNILGIKLEDYAFNYGIYGIDISGVVPDPEEPNKDFVIENGILKSYKGTEKVIVIPESVTEIDESVFRGTDIEKVIFNRALKKIGAFAFWSCKSLKEIVFPEDNELVTIGSNAFQATESLKLANLEALSVWQATAAESYQFHGTGLEKVVLPASMVKLESQFIFASCGSLIELVLPEGLEEIAAHAFRNGGALEELNIPSSVKVIGSLSFFRSGIKRINSLAAEPPALTDVNVFFPIGDVTKVVVPAASIDSYKKAKVWSSLASVIVGAEEPNKDFVIENGILKSYKGTEKVIVIPESVTEIDESVFRGTDIEKVIFNRALKKIGAFAFWSCKSLKEIVFPEDNELVTIGSNAFQATESLKLANLEALSVWQATAAESYQFHGTGLEKVVLPASMVKLESQFIFASCGSLIELVLPEGLEEIAAHAFRNGGALEELNIPSSVKVIGSLSFFRSGIKRINSLAAEPPALTDVNVFFPIGDVTKVVVPAASIDSYKKAKVWSSLASVIVGAEEPDKLYGKISVSEMPSPSDDFIIENGVLIKYVGPGGDVVLPEGITRIADNAFRSNQTVTSVVMQSGITEMGMCVFWDCHYIKRIVFSDTIKVIPTSTCYLNWALEEVILPRDVEEIQSTAFINCYALTSLDFSKYNIRIFGEQSFMGSGLQEVYFSKNVKVIGRQAFFQCYRLKNVTFEEGIELEFLGASVFSACIMLEEVDLSMLDMKELPSEIFRLCSALTKVKLPSQLTSIPWGLFNSCTSLREIDLSDTKITVLNNYVFYKCTSLERVILPERLTEIMKGTFSDTASLEYIVIPESVTKIGNDAFKGSGLKAIVFNSPVPPALGSGIFLKHNDEFRVFVPSDSAEAYKKALGEYSDLVNSSSEFDIRDGVLYKYFGCSEEVTVPYEVKSIAAGAFKGNATLRSVYIGGITAGIGTEAFEGCSSLSYVYLSQSVKTIKDRAFGGCGSLARVVIDASVPPKTGKEVFPLNDGLVIEVIDGAREVYAREWKRYEKLIVENGFTVVDGVLVCYKGIAKDVIVPEGVTELGKYVFQGCAYMETLTLPEGLIKLGDGAINSCNSLRSIKFPDSLSDIGTDSLSFNKSLECLDIPVNVTRIRQNAVRFNDSMTRLNVYCNLNLTGIAFVSLNNLSEIHFYGVIENISNLNFTCMPCLSKVVFYNTVLSLGGEEEKNFDAPFAFNAKLTTVEFRDTVIALGGKAFSNCISLSEVTLYGNLMNLGRSAFSACTKLKGIVVSVDNLFLSNDEYGLLYNKDKTHLFRAMEGWDFDGEYIMPDSVVIMDDYAFSVPEVYVVEVQNLIDIMFSGLGEWNINNFRFTGIKISDKLVSIGAGAFCGCKNLKNVTFGSEGNLKYIMSYAFASTGVVNIELPEGLQLLEERAFYKCSDLTRVVVPVGVSAFNFNMVFEGCDSLTDFVVDENTDIFRIIDGVMFNKEMTVLYFYPSDKEDKEYVVPEGVVKIAANAFYNNRFLSKVTLPESLAVIGDKAFFGTENLTIYVMKSKKPPVLEGRFVSDKTDYYANFYCYIEDIGSRDMTLYYPANAEYNDRIWETYFRNRYKIGREREINDSGYIVAPGRVTEDRYSLTLGLLSANEKQNVISRETEPVFRNETETARYDTARDSAVLTNCPATAVSDRSTAELVAGVLLLAALSCVFKKRR